MRTRAWWHRSMITGMPSGRCFPLALGMYTRLTGRGCQEEMLRVHTHRGLHPAGGSQRDLLVHPGGPAPSIALRHLAHACQRVRPGTQHHLLQRPGLRPVLLLRRLEDPSPQPPYSALVSAPVDGIPVDGGPVAGLVLGSVHVQGARRHRWGGERVSRHVSNLSFGSGGHLHWPFIGSPAHVSNPFGSGHSPVSGQLSTDGHLEGQPPRPWFPVAFRPPAFASWASCSRWEFCSPHGRPTRQHLDPHGVTTFRTHKNRPGWVPSLSRDSGALPAGRPSPAGTRRLL